MKESTKPNILVIDDDPVFRNLLRTILKEKLNVFAVESPSLGFKILKNEEIDILICDFDLPEMNGLKVLDIVKEEYPKLEVIMISNSNDMEVVIEALRKGAADYFKKPFSVPEIWLSIERTRRFSKIQSNLEEVKNKNNLLRSVINVEVGSNMIGSSEEMKSIREQIEMVSQTPDTSVMIIGESGTGKELVARAIHEFSSRKEEIFGAVNMSAIPESLFESEFFGHKKGSFTGAISDKAGWFESANKGTMFFDEIGEMTMALQVKLLRVIEDRKFTKIGTQREQKFDIRIIAATNKTEEELTDGKNFRLDLFHRIGTFIINLPPLRERKNDIPELAYFFLEGASIKMAKRISQIHNDALKLLTMYSFPGNIRELKNLIERAVIVSKENILLPQHFPSIQTTNNGIENPEPENEIYSLKEIEKRTIQKVLRMVNYNKAEAARLLDIEWNALHRRIEKYNIDLPK